jgi:hypothetical protein
MSFLFAWRDPYKLFYSPNRPQVHQITVMVVSLAQLNTRAGAPLSNGAPTLGTFSQLFAVVPDAIKRAGKIVRHQQ